MTAGHTNRFPHTPKIRVIRSMSLTKADLFNILSIRVPDRLQIDLSFLGHTGLGSPFPRVVTRG